MTARERTLLSVAVSTGRVGFVYLSGSGLKDWGVSIDASKSIDAIFDFSTRWFDYYRPDLVVTELMNGHTRKGEITRSLIEAVGAAARELEIPVEQRLRRRSYRNKHEEAVALTNQFPELEPWLPKKRRFWQTEPRNMILFEALALAVDNAPPLQPPLPLDL